MQQDNIDGSTRERSFQALFPFQFWLSFIAVWKPIAYADRWASERMSFICTSRLKQEGGKAIPESNHVRPLRGIVAKDVIHSLAGDAAGPFLALRRYGREVRVHESQHGHISCIPEQSM